MKQRTLSSILLLAILHPLYCSLLIESTVNGIELRYTSNEQKSYQLYESYDLSEWRKVGSKHRGDDGTKEITRERNETTTFYRLVIEDVFSDVEINKSLADQIFGDGFLIEPGTYLTNGSFSLRGSSEGIEIITEGTWSWTVSNSDFNTVTLVANITRYIIPDFGFNGSPLSFASTFGQPAPEAEEATITYTGVNSGYIDSEIRLTNGSTQQEPREFF
ncbi:MAG: hypothetical protein AAF065_15000 [Verrucomicrobiota bacterium]